MKMGTRSNTIVREIGVGNKPIKLVNMYRQMDGYPSGHGKELATFLLSGKQVNGLSFDNHEIVFNGAGCFAAAMVAHFKEGPGGIYINSPTEVLDNDYTYFVDMDTYAPVRGIKVTVMSGERTLFLGTPHEFAEWCDSPEAG